MAESPERRNHLRPLVAGVPCVFGAGLPEVVDGETDGLCVLTLDFFDLERNLNHFQKQ